MGLVSGLTNTRFGIRRPSGKAESDSAGGQTPRDRGRRWRGQWDFAQGVGEDRVDPDVGVDAEDPQWAKDRAGRGDGPDPAVLGAGPVHGTLERTHSGRAEEGHPGQVQYEAGRPQSCHSARRSSRTESVSILRRRL
jgi:hypothetical protein